MIGYCPQFDALIGTLTAREHLTLFARIKGMPESRLHEYVPGLKMRQLDWAGGSNMFLILFLICFEYGYDLQNPIVFFFFYLCSLKFKNFQVLEFQELTSEAIW